MSTWATVRVLEHLLSWHGSELCGACTSLLYIGAHVFDQ